MTNKMSASLNVDFDVSSLLTLAQMDNMFNRPTPPKLGAQRVGDLKPALLPGRNRKRQRSLRDDKDSKERGRKRRRSPGEETDYMGNVYPPRGRKRRRSIEDDKEYEKHMQWCLKHAQMKSLHEESDDSALTPIGKLLRSRWVALRSQS